MECCCSPATLPFLATDGQDLAARPMASFYFLTSVCPSQSCMIAEEGPTSDRKV